jgi:hypothetical protein
MIDLTNHNLSYISIGNVQKAHFQSDSRNTDLTYNRGHLGCPEGVKVPSGDNKGCLDKVSSIVPDAAVLLW